MVLSKHCQGWIPLAERIMNEVSHSKLNIIDFSKFAQWHYQNLAVSVDWNVTVRWEVLFDYIWISLFYCLNIHLTCHFCYWFILTFVIQYKGIVFFQNCRSTQICCKDWALLSLWLRCHFKIFSYETNLNPQRNKMCRIIFVLYYSYNSLFWIWLFVILVRKRDSFLLL